MLEVKGQYYIVRNGNKIIYKGKNEKKVKMLQSSRDNDRLKIEELQERARYGRCY